MASQFAQENNLGQSLANNTKTERPLLGLVAARLSNKSRAFGMALALCLAGLIFAGCVDDVPELVSDDPVLQQGREIYVARCVSCHGATGGGGLGSKLNEGEAVKKYPDIDSQIDVVTNGKNQMAPYKDILTEDEIEAVVRYTREGL